MTLNVSILLTRRRTISLGMLGLGIGYFLWYTPYSGLAKALSGGLLPGVNGPVGGLVLLPGVAVGMTIGMLGFLAASGWWRQAGSARIGRYAVPVPRRQTAASALWMALIVATTTLNFTFAGFSVLFMLVMMRIETIVLAPVMDLLHRRKISRYSWIALVLSFVSALVALTDVTSYRMTAAAFLSLAVYVGAYAGRFDLMNRHAKTGEAGDRRYFVEEHMATPLFLLIMLAIPAVIGQGAFMTALREGFTIMFASPAGLYTIAIGLCYEGLFIFTTLIFLDRREYAFCMPVHVCASLLAGVAASVSLLALFGTPPPSAAQIVAALCVVAAAFTLSYPATRAYVVTRRRVPRLLFVCGGNVARSPMAEVIARAELAAAPARRSRRWVVLSAGLEADGTCRASAEATAEALSRLDLSLNGHCSRPVTPELLRASTAVYCMTEEQRQAVVAVEPQVADRTFRLDPDGDIPDPASGTAEMYVQCARRLRQTVRSRLWELVMVSAPSTRRLVADAQQSA
jgi:protein-tyrosine-phosphatase